MTKRLKTTLRLILIGLIIIGLYLLLRAIITYPSQAKADIGFLRHLISQAALIYEKYSQPVRANEANVYEYIAFLATTFLIHRLTDRRRQS